MNKIKKEELTLSYRRALARELAWKREIKLVRQGRGTRNWTMEEQKELLATGRIRKYVAHHIKSVKEYPEYADHVDNIQFLTRKEHFKAHLYNWKQSLHLYFDHIKQSITLSKRSDGIIKVPVTELKEKYSEVLEKMNDMEQQYSEKKWSYRAQVEAFLKANGSLSDKDLEKALCDTLRENNPEHTQAIVWEYRNGNTRYYLDAYTENLACDRLIKRARERGKIYQKDGSKYFDMAFKEFAQKRENEDRTIANQMEQLAAHFSENSKERSHYEKSAKLLEISAHNWGEETSRQLTKDQVQENSQKTGQKMQNSK